MPEPDNLRQTIEGLGDGFELVRELGRGATAIVYLVRDHELGRDLAVKVIRSSFGHDEEAIARLQREARLVAQLQHPNIVKLYGTRELDDGSFVLLMEHVPGRNLKEMLRAEGALPARRALAILRDVASALAYAHRRRIVHRDVKPENIYIDEEVGTARLADFGVARPWDRDSRLTLPGESLGTPAYMSPEQIDDDDVDGRTDVYSLGLVGYEMLTGDHPWESENLFSIIFKQKNEELPPLSEQPTDAPQPLIGALEKALRKDREQRWDSAEAFLARLRGIDVEVRSDPFDAFGASPSTRSRPADAPPTAPGGRPVAPPPPPAAPPMAPVERSPLPESPEAVEFDEAAAAEAWALGPSLDPATLERVDPDDVDDVPVVARRRGWTRTAALVAGALVLGAAGAYAWGTLGGDGRADPRVLPAFPRPDGAAGAAEGPSEPPEGPPTAAVGDPGAGTPLQPRWAEGPVVRAEVGATVPLVLRLPPDTSGERGPVRVEVTAGDASVTPTEVRPGLDGEARVEVTLPTAAGASRVTAWVGDDRTSGSVLELRALPGAAARLAAFLGDGQQGAAGSELGRILGVRVADSLGNPVPGVRVDFRAAEGGGRVRPATARTDSLGRAYARWTLGARAGEQTLVAEAAGLEAVTFEANATAAPAAADSPATAAPTPPAPATPSEPTPVRVISDRYVVGGTVVCRVIGGGRGSCRGAGDRGQAGSTGSGLLAVAAGVSHVCGLADGGEAFCWGANESGQLGDGSRSDKSSATAVQTDARFQRMALGLSHSCALDGGGLAWCWGRNVGGQLGDGTRDDRAVPRPVAGGARFRVLDAGWNHTCGLEASGRAFCWGLNSGGQLGDGSRIDRLRPTTVQGPGFAQIATGSAHTCGLSGGGVLCWGDNGSGQLGDGTNTARSTPTAVADLPGDAQSVVAGAVHACALLDDGRAFCWGQNLHGQLGDGSTASRSSPVAVAGDIRFRSLEAGGGMTCGISVDGPEYCWGLNQSGQLGDGTRTNRSVPTRVGG